MGINVNSKKVVQHDHTHEKITDTSIENNPTQSTIDDILVYHIYRRKKDYDRSGDGNPLIYAFKNIYGYSIPPASRLLLLNRVGDIVDRFKAEVDATHIMALPSGNTFCAEFAQIISNKFKIAILDNSFLTKRTMGSMLEEYDGNVPKDLNRKNQKLYKDTMAEWKKAPSGRTFAMKDVTPNIRHCFNPLQLATDSPQIEGNILLIDDLLSSGSSIWNTANLLRELGADVKQCITFISGI